MKTEQRITSPTLHDFFMATSKEERKAILKEILRNEGLPESMLTDKDLDEMVAI